MVQAQVAQLLGHRIEFFGGQTDRDKVDQIPPGDKQQSYRSLKEDSCRTPPSEIANHHIPPSRQTSLTVAWTAAEDNVGVEKYVVSWAGGSRDVTDGARSLHVSGLQAGTSYTFKIEAVDAAGNQSMDGPSVTVSTSSGSVYIPEDPPEETQPPVNQPQPPVKEPEQPVKEPQPPVGEAPEIEFRDVAGHWAKAAVERAAKLDIVQGYPDQSFKPDAPTTRAEFITMLARLLQWEGAELSSAFADNDQIASWSKGAIAQAVKLGIIQGYSDGTVRPNQQITRAEMAVMMARALGLSLTSAADSSFADHDSIPSWAKGAIEELHKAGLLSGRDNNQFAPNDKATRAEVIVVLLRILDNQSLRP